MTIAPFGGSHNSLPFHLMITTLTIKTFSAGYMFNGFHVDDSKPLEVFIEVVLAEGIYCASCGNPIARLSVAGSANYMLRGWHCLNCIVAYPSPIQAWAITYTVRKSKHFPEGRATVYIVDVPDKCGAYVNECYEAFGELELKQIHPVKTALELAAQCAEYKTALISRKAMIADVLNGEKDEGSIDSEREDELRRELLEIDQALEKIE